MAKQSALPINRNRLAIILGVIFFALAGPGVSHALYGTPISASSSHSRASLPERAFDGDLATTWSSYKTQPGGSQWLQADFGTSVTINRLTIHWGALYAMEYRIAVSKNGKDWRKIYEKIGGKGGREILTGLRAGGRFLRLTMLKPSSPQDLFVIREIEFPGSDLTARLKKQMELARRDFQREVDTTRPAVAERMAKFGARQIVFAARKVVSEHWYANFGYYASQCELTDFRTKTLYRDGAKLYRLDVASGKLTTVLADPKGGIRDPQVDCSGKKIVFAYRKGGTANYHLYEIGADGTGLRQITEGPFDDFEPSYLPDGGIAFVSSRCERWVNCWMTQVAVIYRCDADGKNMRPLSANVEQDNTPWPLPDGRLLYTRWEYVDRSQVHYHHLWTMNPDGTGQTVYYGNQTSGTVMIDAKPIAGTDKVVASFSPGHGMTEHAGYVTIVNPKAGPDAMAFSKRVSLYAAFRDPWAFSEDCIMTAEADTIQLMNGKGETQYIVRLPEEDRRAGLECHEPRPLSPRPVARVIPARTDLTTATGAMLLANVYEGRNMQGVKPGEIKKLLVLESLPKPINYTGGMEPLTMGGSFTLERVLGTVPVEPDGSAYFEVPPLRAVFFVALDDKNLSVKRMQSFATVQPGETLGCVGCHEQRVMTSRPYASRPAALRRAPSPIEPIRGVPDVYDFPRDIQPILDRHCVQCHDVGKKSSISLAGDRGPLYSLSYIALFATRQVVDGRNRPKSNYPPRALGSSASPLLQKLLPGHHGVKTTAREREIVRLWIEAGAPYPGTYAALGSGMIGGHEQNRLVPDVSRLPSSKAAAEAIDRRCGSCHSGRRELPRAADHDLPALVSKVDVKKGEKEIPRFYSRHSLFNLTRPECSRLLLGPLAANAGGLGSCRMLGPNGRPTMRPAKVFTSTEDPDYRKILASIGDAKAWLNRITRFDMANFQPRPDWVREMKRFGILPATLAAGAKIDVYDAERRYWESLWWKPRAK